MPEDLAIDVKGMTKRFSGRTVVNDIALQVRTGEIYGFLGPNGSQAQDHLHPHVVRPAACGSPGSGTCLGYDVITQSEGDPKCNVGYMTQRFSFLGGPEHRGRTWISWRACMA